MSAVELASWHAVLISVAVSFAANVIVGLLRPDSYHVGLAMVQAGTYTFLLIAPELASSKPDGQAGLAIPVYLVFFSVAAWTGLAVGGRLAARQGK